MIIEFVGFPGSGKSSIARLIAARNPAIRTVTVTKARWTDFVRRPLATARHLAAWRSLWWEWSDKPALARLLKRRISQDSVVDKPGSIVILEEGITYHVWRDTIISPALRDQPWKPLLRGKHPLIALGADDETLHARIKGKRRHGPVNEYLASLSISGPAWRRAADLYEDILAEAARHRPLLRVDTSGGLEDAADRVWNAICTFDPGAGRFAGASPMKHTGQPMPTLWTRAAAVYRNRGPRGLVVALRNKVNVRGGPGRQDHDAPSLEGDYQHKVSGSLAERWQKIDDAIPGGCRTALDVGCNLGDMTALCANRGLWAIGVDRSTRLITQAHQRHHGIVDCGFMRMNITPADIDPLPVFDVVLMLSVHHLWLTAYGPDAASTMLKSLAAKTGSVMIFEGPSRRARYGRYPPDFVDNDEATVTAYLESYLALHVGDLFSSIRPLGKAACVGEREPFRWMYALYR